MSEILKSVVDTATLKPGYTFVDADTISDAEGKRYRLQGYDAPEVAKWKGSEQTAIATAGGHGANQRIQMLAKQEGFTNIVPTGQIDPNGREIIELRNDKGESLTTKLLQSGALRTGRYTTQEDVDAARVADVFRKQATDGDLEWAKAGSDIADLITRESGGDLEFKQQALNELYYSQRPDLYSSAVQFRHSDRDIKNHALSPFSEAWDAGLTGVVEASYGVLNLLGETTGSEALAEIGDAGVARAQARVQESANFLTDYKEVEDFDSAIEFLSTNFAMSLPYMGITIAGAAAAPFTGGLSLAAPAGVYTGQVWNEQEGDNKNAALAVGTGVAQAALDRLGLGFIVKSGKAPAALINDAIGELVKRGATKEVATQTVLGATRKEIAGFVGDAAKVAKDQLAKKQLTLDLLKRAGVGVAGEGVTEGIQESLGYIGAHQDQLTGAEAFDWGALQERATGAIIAGGALGGAISSGGALTNAGAWADVAFRQAPADQRHLSQAGRYAEAELEENGYVPTIQELTAQTRSAPDAVASFDERVDADKTKRANRDLKDTLIDAMAAAPSLWRGATRWIFKPEIQQQSRAARILADMFGGNLQRTYSGSNFENWKQHQVAKYKGLVEMPEKFWAVMNGGKKPNQKDRAKISGQVYEQLQAATDAKTGKFNPDLLPQDTPNRDYIVQFGQQLQTLSDKLWNDQRKYNPDLGYLPNYLARYKSFDKNAVARNRHGFITALRNTFQMSEADANKITDAIENNAEINDIEEAFSVTQGIPRPGSHKKRTLDLAEKKEFQEFMQQDVFSNISNAVKAATRYQAYEQFVGKNGANIAKLLDQMQAEGVPAETVNKIAAQMKNYLDAESGNYKRPTSEFGKFLEKVQKNFMLLTTFAGLGLSAVSSLPELALSMKGLTRDQIFGGGGLKAIGTEFANSMWAGMKEVGALPTREQVQHKRSAAQESLHDLGYYEWEVGAATTTGVTETSALKQKLIESFFKWNGLQGWTNYTRAIRASIAGDFIFNHMETIMNHQGPVTNEVQEAREALRTLGLDPERVINLTTKPHLNENQEAVLQDMMREATFNFINEGVALPQSANRPLIFQDPRFALFTQFQGFIATITANHIPKLWGEYVKRGSPAMKYNAFALMVTMIALGFASQHLKDLLKYGQSTPYLDDPEYIRRGIFSSGLVGTGERVIDTLFPLYDQSSKTAGEWVWNETTGQSPALSNVTSLGEGAGEAIQGNLQGGLKSALRSTPFIAPLTGARNAITDAVSGWNFKGDN